jgi:hypothetical protein
VTLQKSGSKKTLVKDKGELWVMWHLSKGSGNLTVATRKEGQTVKKDVE